ncbi:jg18554 [Pararge aegeria aegeria]|uniref:Jg18554 protein n=1 Tax=Pararge aegeria aegeria TaxID=348720 RepID=A0A8S4QRM6_9NEOP|nr:jg18554 [Pararge aegeria aegeria]
MDMMTSDVTAPSPRPAGSGAGQAAAAGAHCVLMCGDTCRTDGCRPSPAIKTAACAAVAARLITALCQTASTKQLQVFKHYENQMSFSFIATFSANQMLFTPAFWKLVDVVHELATPRCTQPLSNPSLRRAIVRGGGSRREDMLRARARYQELCPKPTEPSHSY